MINKHIRIVKKLVICGVICGTLSGCAGTIIAGLTLSQLFTAGSITSSILTGKGFSEHALDVVTGQDCRILDAIFRSDRAICEPKNSVATHDDFRGLIALLDTPAGSHIQLADIPMGKDQFPAVNVSTLDNSPKLLTALNRNNIVLGKPVDVLAQARTAHLISATHAYNSDKIIIPSLGANDLRKRLTSRLF